VRVYTLRAPSRDYQPEHASLVPLTTAVGSPFAPAAWAALLYWLARRPHVLVREAMRMIWASRRSAYALAGHIGYLPAAARLARLLEHDDVEWIHAAWSHFPGSVAYLVSKLTGRGFSMAAHAGSDLYRTQAFLAEKVRTADSVVACVRRNAEMLRRLAGPQARVECVHHGVDLARFDGTGRSRAPEPLLLSVGRLVPGKGFEDAIAAMAPLREAGVSARLALVGDGPLRPMLESMARDLGVSDRVEFRGTLTHADLLPLYRSAWLLLAPSKVLPNGRRDGIPNVVVEAMAMGVPCLGTPTGGLDEVIVPGETGALAPPGDPAALARAIETLLRDPEALERMGQSARRMVVRDFDAERNFERHLAVIGGRRREAVPHTADREVASA
jgi:glycosyltransferase involved in cell wall biosynthesis